MGIGGNSQRFSSSPALIMGLALALLTLVTYHSVLDNGFVTFDDNLYVTDSPWIEDGLTAEGISWAFSHYYAYNWHPLTVLSHMLDTELFGLEPRGHHLTSLLLHVANVVLLFILVRRMTGSLWRSALVAAFFAIHPLRVESVAWVSERKDVLSTFFVLLSVAAYLSWVRTRSMEKYGLMLLGFLFALMAKAMVVTLPFLLLLLDIWPLQRIALTQFSWREALSLVREKIPLVALASGVGVATIVAQGETLRASGPVSLNLKISNALVSLVDYLGKTFVPVDLAVFYPFPVEIATWKVVAALALVLAVSAGALIKVRRAPYAAVGWFWFVGALIPVLGLLKVGNQAMADRYTYIPSIGLTIALVWGLQEIVGRRFPKILAVLAVTGLVALAFTTRTQIGYWEDGIRLFRHTAAVTEDNYLAHFNLGKSLREAGDRLESEYHYRIAVALHPEDADTRAALGQALRMWGEPEEALVHLRAAADLDPGQVRIHHSLAMTLDDLGREDAAADHLEKILILDPDHVEAHRGLADLHFRGGDLGSARRHFEAAFSAAIPTADLAIAYSRLLVAQNDIATAEAVLREASAASPGAESLSRALAELSALAAVDQAEDSLQSER
jgi:Tfp pilus assembly protein PilF